MVRERGNHLETMRKQVCKLSQCTKDRGRGQREGKNLNYHWHCCAINQPKNCPLPLNLLLYEIIKTFCCGG